MEVTQSECLNFVRKVEMRVEVEAAKVEVEAMKVTMKMMKFVEEWKTMEGDLKNITINQK